MIGICSLSVLVFHETLVVLVLMYVSETLLWKEKDRSKIRSVQMDNFRVLLGVRRMNSLEKEKGV